jgi:hypothetical protein
VPEENQQTETVLIAHATVFLVNGDSFELLPFENDDDVKSSVNALMENWAKSGFLLRGKRIYPWHQVQRVEVTAVEELSRAEAAQNLTEWSIQDTYQVQQSFWKTKKPREKKDEKQDEKKEGSESQPPAGH